MGQSLVGGLVQKTSYSLTMNYVLLTLLLKSVLANVRETDKVCGAQEVCLQKEECSSFTEKLDRLNKIENKKSSEYSKLRRELQTSICNKKEKAVCCKKENPCEASNTCIARSDCPYANDQLKEYKRFEKQNKKDTANAILQELRNRVCNTEERLICCPPPKTPESDYLPALGSCGLSTSPPSNIVGGTKTRPGDFPFAALLGYVVHRKLGRLPGQTRRVTRREIQWTCGGTLINQWYVLTAAHCQGNTAETRISRIRLGDWSVEGFGGERDDGNLPLEQDFDIQEDDFKAHEDYLTVYENGHKNTVNDIALVKLPRPAILNEGVQMACLPFKPLEIQDYLKIRDLIPGLVGRNSTVIGWGKTDVDQLESFGGLGSRVLLKLQVPILSMEQCSAKSNRFTPRETQICAGGDKGKDSCRGDSGGGLFIQESEQNKNTPWYLMGIVSFGSKECGNGRPGIYTRVSSFIPWIVNNLK